MAGVELSGSWGVAFLVSAGIVAEIIAKACSSPQTLEINAKMRSPTLWKWVNIGAVEAIALVTIAAMVDKKYRTPIVLGATMELLITWLEYLHGKRSGLRSSLPGTETYVTNGS